MIKKLLIANRGEIALSILRNCRELGIKTVTIYSTADKDQLSVFLADESICIGSGKSSESYLNEENILMVAKKTNCDAIHPGYGFLSENWNFAKKVEAAGLKFVGPSSKVIRLMGDKISAKNLMQKNKIPTVPGCSSKITSTSQLLRIADEIGYPLILKASAGGGGKGMRKVSKKEDLISMWEITKKEAKEAFNNDDVYLEKYIENPRHIEVQILSDSFGNTIHLFERECSIQRNNQKLIEEAPCQFLNSQLIDNILKAAIKCAKVCEYESAGTVEFIVDENENFYFMEMNTRLQVEYAVTEMITGVNIIKQQLYIASGMPIKLRQEDVKKDGHAIEIRVNAQDPLDNFNPQCTEVNFYLPPGGMNTRIESALYKGIKILPFYDSMIAKIIVKSDTRLSSIKKMRRAIEETIIDGVKTNLGFQYAILHEEDFIRGRINTGYIDAKQAKLLKEMRMIERRN